MAETGGATMEELSALGVRTLCDIFQDMRIANKTRNYSYLKGLIEEAQYRANRMEDHLYSRKSVEELEERRVKLKAEVKELEKK